MIPILFYLGAVALIALSALLTRKTSYFTRSGGSTIEKRRRRKIIGTVLIVPAIFLVGLAVMTQIFPGNAPETDTPPTSGSAASRPQVATVAAPPGRTSPSSGNEPAPTPAPTSGNPDQPQAGSVAPLLSEAFQLVEQKKLDAALEKVNAALQAAPQNPVAYELRGSIYAKKNLLDQAGKDYQTVLQLDGANVGVKFDLAEIKFVQKNYDGARPDFLALERDPDLGDFAGYKVFLCDLFGGHEHVAASELDAFNQVGSNASYYFANAAWSLYHQKTEDARGWLKSAENIYAPNKFKLYETSLIHLGYLPLPPPP